MNATDMKNRAAAYVRCSTDKQDQSIPDQQQAILEYARERELTVIRWFIDEGKSGTRAANRPGFQELQDVVKNGSKDFQTLLIYDISRWGRFGDPDEAAHYEFIMKDNGVAVKYTHEGFENDNTAGSQIIKSVHRTMAGEFSKKLAKLTIRGNKSNAEKGYFNGGPPPYGYRRMLCESDGSPIREMAPGEHKAEKSQKIKLVLGPDEETKAVRYIYRLYVEQGHSAKATARILETERRKGGTPSPLGGEWTPSTVHGMLRNPVYCGRIVWNRRCYSHLIYPIEIGKHHDESEWVSCEKAHPGIVSEKTWEEAQKGARRNSNFRKPKPTSPYLLVGLIRCIKCGRNYQGQLKARSKKKPNSYRYYNCGTYQRYGKSDCKSFSIPKEKIEKQIIDQIFKRLKRSGALDRIAKLLEEQLSQENITPEEEVTELKSELEEVEIKERRILKSVEEGMSYQMVRERLEHLEAHKGRLQDEIAALDGSVAVVTDPETALEQMMGFLGNFRAILKEGTLDEQRTLIQCFVDRIEVDPEVPSIEVFLYKIPEVDLENLQELETVNS